LEWVFIGCSGKDYRLFGKSNIVQPQRTGLGTTVCVVKHQYEFFETPEMIGKYVVFGQQKAKENLVEKIDNASRGLEASKRLWILLGPPGAAKSRSMD